MRDLDWQRLAACDGMETEAFFPEHHTLMDPHVEAACNRCLVREDCLAWALQNNEEHGIWGGLTAAQRKQISTTRSRVRCPDCRSDSIFELGRSEVCLACGLSWPV